MPKFVMVAEWMQHGAEDEWLVWVRLPSGGVGPQCVSVRRQWPLDGPPRWFTVGDGNVIISGSLNWNDTVKAVSVWLRSRAVRVGNHPKTGRWADGLRQRVAEPSASA